jgi:hypothetical protein
MKVVSPDHDLRYLAPRHWYRRANDRSWLKISKKSASIYLRANFSLPVDLAMRRVIENSHLDLAGDFYVDPNIHAAISRCCNLVPIDSEVCVKSGEYMLPDGRRMLLTADVHLCRMAYS